LVGQYLLTTISDLLGFVGEEVSSGYGGYYSNTLCTVGQREGKVLALGTMMIGWS
jgi:hypothetical protein